MIRLYEPPMDPQKDMLPYVWEYDPDADTIILLYEPYTDSWMRSLVIEDAMKKSYLDRMFMDPAAAEWLPER